MAVDPSSINTLQQFLDTFKEEVEVLTVPLSDGSGATITKVKCTITGHELPHSLPALKVC